MDEERQAPVYHKIGPAVGNMLSTEALVKGMAWIFENRRQAFADMMLAINGLDFTVGTSRKSRNGDAR